MQKRGHREVLVTHRDENGNDVSESEEWTRRRFGRSTLRGAPGLFLSILESTVEAAGGTFVKVNPLGYQVKPIQPVDRRVQQARAWLADHRGTPGVYIQRDLLAVYNLKHCEPVINPEKAKRTPKKEESRKNGRIRQRHERKVRSTVT